jgi:hypothetical protein
LVSRGPSRSTARRSSLSAPPSSPNPNPSTAVGGRRRGNVANSDCGLPLPTPGGWRGSQGSRQRPAGGPWPGPGLQVGQPPSATAGSRSEALATERPARPTGYLLFWIAICKFKFSTSLSWLLNFPF